MNYKKYHKIIGYTMIEILLVVGLIGLFSIIAIPGTVKMFRLFSSNGAADQLAADIRYAEQQAITQVRVVNIQLNYQGVTPTGPYPFQNSYAIYYTVTNVTTIIKSAPMQTASNVAYITQSDFTNGLISLQPNGSTTPLNDGRIMVCQTSDGNTTNNQHFYAVSIKYTTGKVKVFKDVWPSSW